MTSSLDKLRGWWKDKLKFDKNYAPAVAKYEE